MRKSIASNKIELNVPENFKELSAQEIKEMFNKNLDNDFVLQNKDLHLMYEVNWKTIPALKRWQSLSKIVPATEKLIIKNIPGYERIDDVNITIDNQEAVGFKYSYIVNDIHMIGEYVLVKYGNELYSFVCIGRVGYFDENHAIYEDMLNSIKFK